MGEYLGQLFGPEEFKEHFKKAHGEDAMYFMKLSGWVCVHALSLVSARGICDLVSLGARNPPTGVGLGWRNACCGLCSMFLC